MRISVLIGTRNRTAPLVRCLDSVARQRLKAHEVIVLDDASDDVRVSDVLRDAGVRDVRVLRSETPLGVGGGRNMLFAAASGDVFFVLDDDAYFSDAECLTRVADVLRDRPTTGLVATRIVDRRFAPPRVLAPFAKTTRLRSPRVLEQAQLVSYFLGGGHAMRRQVYERVGGYHDSFVFGEEELDLSYRAIQAGFEVFYAPDIVLEHDPMPSVLRSADRPQSELFYHAQNRLFIARKYLPARYVGPYLAIWLARYMAEALRQGTLVDLLKGMKRGWKTVAQEPRTPLSFEALAYLRRNHGRLWF